MKYLKVSLALAAALTAGLSPINVSADETAEAEAVEQAAGTVSGSIVLPEGAPDWFRGGKLAPGRVVVVLEERFKRPSLDLPEGFREWSREEQIAWRHEFMKSDAYKEYMAKIEELRRNATRIEIKVNADGSFSSENVKPGGYNVSAVIAHEDADPAQITRQSWAWGRGRPVLVEAGAAADTGEIRMRIQNVLMPGEQAPDWSAKAYDGSAIKLSDFRGKYVLIDFWATWCGPCKAEIPNLKEVYNDFAGEKFEMIALSLDKDIGLPKAFHEQNPAAYVCGYLGHWNKTETTARDYGVTGIPSIWLIGPDGKIVARDLRGRALREAVRKAVEGEVRTD